MGFYIMNDLEMIFVSYNLLAIDFEFMTTRIIKNKAKKYLQEIIEIGAVFKGEDDILEFETIVKPRHYIKSKHKRVYTIYSERFLETEIEKGIDLKEAIEKLKDMYIPKETVWLSWGKSEYDILRAVCKNYKIPMPFLKEDYLDLSLEFKKFYGIKHNISLDKALDFLNITSLDRHKALPDARALMKIIKKMFMEGYEIQKKY